MKIDKDDPLGLLGGKAPSGDDPLGLLGDQPDISKKTTITEDLSRMVGNIPGDIAETAKGMYQMARHPIDTIQGVADIAAGGLASLNPAFLQGLPPEVVERKMKAWEAASEPVKNAVMESIKDPKGIFGRVWDYTVEHPVGQALNVSGLATGGASLAGRVGLGTTQKVLSQVGKYSNPFLGPQKIIEKGVEKIAAPIANLIKPGTFENAAPYSAEALKNLELAKETGVPLTPADITGKKVPSLIETQLKENIGSSNVWQEAREKKLQAVEQFAKKQESNLGGPTGHLEGGQIAQETAWKRYEHFMQKADKYYAKVPVKPDTKIPTSTLSDTAMMHIDDLGKMENPTIKKILNTAKIDETITEIPSSLVNQYGKPLPTTIASTPAYQWQELLNDQSILRKMVNSTGDYNKKRILKDLIYAINDDIARFSKTVDNPAIKESLDKAVQFYREGDVYVPGVKLWRERQIDNLLKTNSPEDIVNKFIKASPNESDIKRLKDAAGPIGFQKIKQSWFSDMITKGEDQSFSAARYVTSYDNYKRGGNLKTMLTGAEQAGTDKLYEVSKIISTAEKIAGNPSGTARTTLNQAYTWVRHPVYMVVTQLASNRLARLYFGNKEFQDLLIRGFKLNPNSVEAARTATKMSAIAQRALPDEGAE